MEIVKGWFFWSCNNLTLANRREITCSVGGTGQHGWIKDDLDDEVHSDFMHCLITKSYKCLQEDPIEFIDVLDMGVFA